MASWAIELFGGWLGEEFRIELAESVVEESIDYMFSEVVNAGQESQINDIVQDFEAQILDIADGEFEEVEPNHPEAVGIMVGTANEMCKEVAELCAFIKAIEEALGLS